MFLKFKLCIYVYMCMCIHTMYISIKCLQACAHRHATHISINVEIGHHLLAVSLRNLCLCFVLDSHHIWSCSGLVSLRLAQVKRTGGFLPHVLWTEPDWWVASPCLNLGKEPVALQNILRVLFRSKEMISCLNDFTSLLGYLFLSPSCRSQYF